MTTNPEIKTERKKVESWLKKNYQYINRTGMEREIGAPKGLIQKWIKYDKMINDKWILPIHSLIKNFTKFSIR